MPDNEEEEQEYYTEEELAFTRVPKNAQHAELIRIRHTGLYHRHLQDLLNKALNARELRFVEAYVAGDDRSIGNAYRSALVAGYSHMTSVTNAGSWIMNPYEYPPHEATQRKPHVWAAIQRRQAEIREKTALSDAAIVNELRKLAFFNAANFIKTTSDGDPYIDLSEMSAEDMAAIQEAQMEDFLDGRGEDARDVRKVRVKTHDKLGALNTLSRIYGLHQPQRHVISGDPNNPLMITPKHDLSKLNEEELELYLTLVRKMEGKGQEGKEENQNTIDVTPNSQPGNGVDIEEELVEEELVEEESSEELAEEIAEEIVDLDEDENDFD